MHSGKDGTSDREQVVSAIGHFVTINKQFNRILVKIIRMHEQCIPGLRFSSLQNAKAWERGYTDWCQ